MAAATTEASSPFIIVLTGEIDVARSVELRDLLHDYLKTEAASAAIDLERVNFMDSTGLTFLLRVRKEAAARGGRVTLLRAQTSVTHVLAIAGLDRAFDFRADRGPASFPRAYSESSDRVNGGRDECGLLPTN